MGINRVKQIRKKTNNGYNSVPIGTESYLVDMLSNLDLEVENRLGNCSAIQIKEVEGKGTFIKEWYFKTLDQEEENDDEQKLIEYIESLSDVQEAIQNKENAISKLNYFLFTSITSTDEKTVIEKVLWQPTNNNTSLQIIGWKDSNDNNKIKFPITEIDNQTDYIHTNFTSLINMNHINTASLSSWDDFLEMYGPEGTEWADQNQNQSQDQNEG